MPQISYIPYKDIQEAKRFDADYFKPEYLRESHILAHLETITIGDLSFVTDGQHGYHEVDQNSPISHLTAKNAKKWFADKIDADKLAKWVDDSNKRSSLEEDDIILSTRGSVGYCAIVTKEVLPANIDQDVARININLSQREFVSPPFLLTYLNSYFGQNWIRKNSSGMVQQGMSLEKVRNIKIPILPKQFQEKIDSIVGSAYSTQTQSKQLYQEAEELLLRELGLLEHETKHSLSFSATKKSLDEAGRIDAEYFQPKYREIIEKIENYGGGFDTVKNQFKQNKTLAKKDKDYYNYVEISDVSVSNGEIIPNKITKEDIPANGKVALYKNDLLISKVRPYRGAVAFVDFEAENLLGSGAFTVLQEKTNYKKEVLLTFFKMDCIKDLLLRYNCGTSYPVIKDEDILNLKIPLIKPEIQKQIADKVQESHSLRKESKNLLEEAKRKVEEEIEKNI